LSIPSFQQQSQQAEDQRQRAELLRQQQEAQRVEVERQTANAIQEEEKRRQDFGAAKERMIGQLKVVDDSAFDSVGRGGSSDLTFKPVTGNFGLTDVKPPSVAVSVPDAPLKPKEIEFGDSSVVDLRGTKTTTVDPAIVKGLEEKQNQPNAGRLDADAVIDTASKLSPAERVKRSELETVWRESDKAYVDYFEAGRRGDEKATKQAWDHIQSLAEKAKQLRSGLVGMEHERLNPAMKVLLQKPEYAAAWKEAFARIRNEEVAAFAKGYASVEPERQKLMEQLVKGGLDEKAARLEAQKLSDRLRFAEVEAMEHAEQQLRAEAERLIREAASTALPLPTIIP
jgi:hypothetical protein